MTAPTLWSPALTPTGCFHGGTHGALEGFGSACPLSRKLRVAATRILQDRHFIDQLPKSHLYTFTLTSLTELAQWFPTGSILPPRGHLAIFVTLLSKLQGPCYWHLVTEPKDAAKCLAVHHRTAPTTKDSQPQRVTNARFKAGPAFCIFGYSYLPIQCVL